LLLDSTTDSGTVLDSATDSGTVCAQFQTPLRFGAGLIILGFVDLVAFFHLVLYL